MCKVIAIVNQKGGVAKTTTTVNLGIGLVREGKKVLLIDADSQGSLSSSLGVEEPDELDVTLSTIMGKVINEEDYGKREGVIVHEEGVSFLPCNIELSGLEVTLVNTMRREYILKEYITSVRNLYDYILIDCNSSLGMVTMNALTAADSVIIPIEAAYLSVKGLQQLITTIGRTKKYLNPNLGIEGIVFTKMVGRTNYAMVLNNVMYIDLCVDKLYTCTYLDTPGDDEDVESTGEEIQKQAENQANKPVTKFCTTSYKTLYDPPTKFCTTPYKSSYDHPAKFCTTLPQNDVPPHTKFCKTNTENTTENTEEITYPINPLGTGVKADTMDRMDEVRSFIKDNIDYDGLLQCHPAEKMDINELVELIVETIAVKQPVIRINKYDFPYDVVRSRFEKIDFHTMEYVLECLRNNTTKVRNIRSYMLTTLYNAPVTCSDYYKAEVNHDF